MSDSDDRVRCLALGIRIREQTDFLVASAARLALAKDEPAREVERGIVNAEVENLDELFRQSESCGIEANGYISGEFAGVHIAAKGGDTKALLQAASDFARELHVVANESVSGGAAANEAPTPDGVYAFIEAETLWNSLGPDQRAELLREVGDDPANYVDLDGNPDIATRPYGNLSPDTLDALEGIAMSKISAAKKGTG